LSNIGAASKLEIIKSELQSAENLSEAFSQLASKVSNSHSLSVITTTPFQFNSINMKGNKTMTITYYYYYIRNQVSECPSASRGGNLGTFKPGMMVKEFDRVVFEKEVGVVHGPVETQFGAHLILITRRFEGDEKK